MDGVFLTTFVAIKFIDWKPFVTHIIVGNLKKNPFTYNANKKWLRKNENNSKCPLALWDRHWAKSLNEFIGIKIVQL